MADFNLDSLRGGQNDTDPAISLPEDQCVLAKNVEFVKSLLGERRLGTTAVTVTGSGIDGRDRVMFLYRHLPSADKTAAELFAWGMTDSGSTSSLVRKTTSWSTITVADALLLTGFLPYQIQAVSSGGKLFFAYRSAVDRLHVWDGTTFRRTGLAEPAAPTTADNGTGTFQGIRYYRVRYTVQSGGVTLRRSEPSNSASITPSGTGSGVTVTKPASISEDETHWELEASLNDADFYVLATTAVGTTTVIDTQAYAAGYAQSFDLSEDIGDYTLLESARFLVVDGDRLLLGSSNSDATHNSRVAWTPTSGANGVGNNERTEDDTDPFKDLDYGVGGELTSMISGGLGTVYVFKYSRIYKLVRSGLRSRAYDDITLSTERGALYGSVAAGVDENGDACVYFLDPEVGPCRISRRGGLEQCGRDVFETWVLANKDATKVVASACYYPKKKQMIWNFASGANNIPSVSLVLHVNETRPGDSGVRRGYASWDGNRSKALAMCLYSSNINDNAARNNTLVPFIALEGLGLIHICDTAVHTDNAVAYSARIVTKPYFPANMIHKFGVLVVAILAKATTSAKITFKMIRDFGLETYTSPSDVTFDASTSETQVIKTLDDASWQALQTVHFEFLDPSAGAGTQFELNRLVVTATSGQKAAGR